MSNPKLKWIIFIITVFIVGEIIGFLGGQIYQRYEMQQRRRGRGGPPPRPQNFITDLKQQLDLTTEQVTKIENILELNRKRIEQELAPFREKANSIRKEVETQIESVLTPEQKVKYKQFRDKMEKERKKFETEQRQRLGNDTIQRFMPPPSREFLPPPPK